MLRSSQERLWLLGGGVCAFVMVLIGYFFLISPQRDSTSSVNAQVAAARDQTSLLQNRIDALGRQNQDLSRYTADLAQAQLALPSTSGLPDFLRTLQSIGNASLADVTSLTVGPPTDVTSVAGGTPPVAATAPSQTATAGPATHAVPAGPRVYALSITAQVSGSTTQLGEFLDQLQSVQPRAVLIGQITIGSGSPGATSGSSVSANRVTTMQLTMQAFVAPASDAELAQLSQAAPR
jgi:type IV pilus assembly protein PilO